MPIVVKHVALLDTIDNELPARNDPSRNLISFFMTKGILEIIKNCAVITIRWNMTWRRDRCPRIELFRGRRTLVARSAKCNIQHALMPCVTYHCRLRVRIRISPHTQYDNNLVLKLPLWLFRGPPTVFIDKDLRGLTFMAHQPCPPLVHRILYYREISCQGWGSIEEEIRNRPKRIHNNKIKLLSARVPYSVLVKMEEINDVYIPYFPFSQAMELIISSNENFIVGRLRSIWLFILYSRGVWVSGTDWDLWTQGT